MTDFRRRFDKFNHYSYSFKDYYIGRKLIHLQDFERSSRFGLIFAIAMCLFALFSLAGVAPQDHLMRYVGMLFLILLLRLMCGFLVKRDHFDDYTISKMPCRIIGVVMLAFGIMESMGDTGVVATAILPLYVVCGVMYVDTMLSFTLTCVLAQVCLTWTSFVLKDDSLAYGDLLNGFTFVVVAVSVHYVVQKERIAHCLAVFEVRKLRKETLMRATFDKLSGTLNRVTFSEINEKVLTGEHGPMAVFLMDVDDFKGINDKYGHDRGDYAIETLGKVLKESISVPSFDVRNVVESISNSEGNFVGRFGGDEFIVVIRENVTEENVRLMLERILNNVRNIRISRESTLSVTIGAMMISADQHDCRSVMIQADNALYEAKNAGKNRYLLKM